MADETPAAGHELEMTWKHVLSVWWSVLWRTYVLVLGAALGFQFLSGAGGVVQAPTPIGLALWGTLVLLWAIRSSLRKQYQTFRIALVPVTADAGF